MAYANGKVPATHLKDLGGFSLLTSVANAYKHMALIAHMDNHEAVGPAGAFGSGYRDLATQRVFYAAAHGDKDAIAKARLDNNSTISVAAPGYSSHGQGDRVDLLFAGRSPQPADLELAARYGFTREFGRDDPNHFQHDRRTAISGVRGYDKIRLTARFLISRHLGATTAAERTGVRDKEFILLIQRYGKLEKWYHGREDGITGPMTEATFDRIWDYLKTA